MKNRVFISLITMLTLLVSSWPALGAIHPGSKVIGVSTWPDESGEFELVNQPPGPLRLYLMVYGYDEAQGIVAWDCALILPPGVTIDHVELAGGGVNQYIQAGNFRVETTEPLMAVDGMVLLATVDLNVRTEEELGIDVGPDPLWGNTSFMGFARQTQEGMRERLNHPRDCPGCPVFTLTHIQADEAISWPHIKAFYRP
jgi:hypothetical protein